jgi:hypothetical protein
LPEEGGTNQGEVDDDSGVYDVEDLGEGGLPAVVLLGSIL